MAIRYRGFDFAAAPGTACHWWCKACCYADLGPAFVCDAYKPFEDDFRRPAQLKVSLTRHPMDYLLVMFRYGYPKPSPLDELDWNQSLDSLVCEYLRDMPGAISKIILGYKADTYIRVEDLPDAFLEFGRSLGVPEQTLERPIVSRASGEIMPVDRNGGTWHRKLVEVERELCDVFDYY